MVYDPASKNAFSMNGDSHNSTGVNAKTGEVVKTIDLGGAPEFAVADGKGMIYACISDKNEIAAIDTRSLAVKSRWPVAPAGSPTALAVDREHRRLFTAGTDAAAYDPESGMIFVSTIEGSIHIFHEDSPDKFSVVDTVKTEYGAKTMGLDAKTHHLFLDTADFSASESVESAIVVAFTWFKTELNSSQACCL